MAFELGREEMPQFTDEAIAELETYSWPGNVRELKNLVERAVYRSDSMLIADISFDPFRPPHGGPPPLNGKGSVVDAITPSTRELMDRPLKEAVRDLEIRLVRRALQRTTYNQRKAARTLGLTYHQFRGLYRKYIEEIE
jgi:psp operon transcriptional activator